MVSEEEVRYAVYALTGFLTPQFLSRLLLAVLVFAASASFFYLLASLASAVILRLGSRKKESFGAVLLSAVRQPATVLITVLAAYLAIAFSFPDFTLGGMGLPSLLLIASIIVAGIALASAVEALISWYGGELQQLPNRGNHIEAVFPILRKLAAISVYLLTAAAILSYLGIDIAPVIAGLGIAGLAVALALQETLSNFFAGVYLLADKPVRIGDSVRLSDGTEGIVREIGWRSTKITLSDGNDLIIPNAQLAQEKITNYCTPDGSMRLSVQVDVSADENLERVERVLKHAVENVSEETGGLIKPSTPSVRLESLGCLSLRYSVYLHSESPRHPMSLRHRIYKEIIKEFRREGIDWDVPTQFSITKKKR